MLKDVSATLASADLAWKKAHLALCVEGAEQVGKLVEVLGDAVGRQIDKHVLQRLCELDYLQPQCYLRMQADGERDSPLADTRSVLSSSPDY